MRDRDNNKEIMKRCGLQRSLSERGEAAVRRWFRHIERTKGEGLKKKIYRADVEGNRGRGRPEKKAGGWSERLFE